jgi:hypothetical protein
MSSLYPAHCKALLLVGLSACAMTAQAATTTLTFNYMATNLSGAFAAPAATVQITDLSDLGISNPIAGATGGVQVNFSVLNLSQFATGAAGTTVFISSYELNFPGTEEALGYSSANFANVSGVALSGGIEWEENGATWGWGAGTGDPSFWQELNFSAAGITQGQSSVINLFNAAGQSDISVASLLGNPVVNATTPTQPNAYGWIKLRGTGNADPALRGIASSGFWGASETGGNPVQNRLNIVALAPVPEPSAYAMLGLGLGVLAFVVRRRRVSTLLTS